MKLESVPCLGKGDNNSYNPDFLLFNSLVHILILEHNRTSLLLVFYYRNLREFKIDTVYYSLRPEKHVARVIFQKNPQVSPDQTRTPRHPPPTVSPAVLLPAAVASPLPRRSCSAPRRGGSPAPPLPRRSLPPQAPPFLIKIFDFRRADELDDETSRLAL